MAPIMATIYVIMVAIICLMNLLAVRQRARPDHLQPPPRPRRWPGRRHRRRDDQRHRARPLLQRGRPGYRPNAAATATVSHLACQGLIQSLGVFTDTIVVRTATAFVILLVGPEVWGGDGVGSSNLTTLAVANELGA